MSFSVKADFFCMFKTGDNINYNLDILNYFYELYSKENNTNKELLLKPIIIINISIIEAVLYDFYKRMNANVNEGVSNINEDILNDVRSKHIDKFAKYIDSAKKHDLFDISHTNFYRKLHDLRSVRNRVHIQNEKFESPQNEALVFNEKAKELSEKCLEFVVKTMDKKYKRPSRLHGNVDTMNFPWNEKFTNI
jgi:hypothetical protein